VLSSESLFRVVQFTWWSSWHVGCPVYRPVIIAESQPGLESQFQPAQTKISAGPGVTSVVIKTFLSRIDKGASTWCSEYVISKEGTARDEGGTAGADARSSEGAAGSSGCGQDWWMPQRKLRKQRQRPRRQQHCQRPKKHRSA
jgi:hypothetical protein